MSIPTVYRGHDNPIRWRLLQDGQMVEPLAVHRVVLHLSPAAGSGAPVIVDTTVTENARLIDERRAVEARLGLQLDLEPGVYLVSITAYDVNHPNGIAWATSRVNVVDWP